VFIIPSCVLMCFSLCSLPHVFSCAFLAFTLVYTHVFYNHSLVIYFIHTIHNSYDLCTHSHTCTPFPVYLLSVLILASYILFAYTPLCNSIVHYSPFLYHLSFTLFTPFLDHFGGFYNSLQLSLQPLSIWINSSK
jgi:hypothetical protein